MTKGTQAWLDQNAFTPQGNRSPHVLRSRDTEAWNQMWSVF